MIGLLKVPARGEIKDADLIAKICHRMTETALSRKDFKKVLHSLVIEVQDSTNNSLTGNDLGMLAH